MPTPDKPEQPDNETKLRTLRGESTGWDYRFHPNNLPCSAHAHWSAQEWINFIGDNWFRKATHV